MLKQLFWFFKFRKSLKSLKTQYLLMILTVKRDFEHYQKINTLSEYEQEEIQFHLDRMQDYYKKINHMNVFESGILQRDDFKNYLDLFKKNLLLCNDILMIGARQELFLLKKDIKFLVKDTSHSLFNDLSPDLQKSFIEALDLATNAIHFIDNDDLQNFAKYKYDLDVIINKIIKQITQKSYEELLQKIRKLQESPLNYKDLAIEEK